MGTLDFVETGLQPYGIMDNLGEKKQGKDVVGKSVIICPNVGPIERTGEEQA